MSDEIKNPDLPETPNDASDTPQPSEALQGELDGLRELFQQEWDRTVAESESQPPIQDLEYEPEGEDEPEEETEETEETQEPVKEKKPKKKRGKALLVVLIIVLVLVLIPLIAYFVISIKVPSFNNFMSAYTNAAAAKEPEDRISYLEDALGYCEDGTFLDSMKQSIMEDIAVAKCEASGYAAAMSYVDANFTEEMLAKPYSKEFKELLAVADQTGAIADGAYDAVKAAVDKAGGGEIDYGAIADSLGAPALIREDVKTILGYLGSSLTEEAKLGDTVDAETIDPVMTNYLTAVQGFDNLGADTQKLLEIAATKLFDYGLIYEANALIENYFDEDMLASPKTEAFTEMKSKLEAISKLDVDVYAVAQGLFENDTDSAEEIKNALDLSLPDAQAQVIVTAAGDIIDGLKLEAEKDLPKAAESFTTALNTLSALGLNVNGLCGKLMTLHMQLGDPQGAFTVRETYLPEAIDGTDEALAATVKEIDEINAAVSAVEEVFYPYYYGYYYGTPIDKDALYGELDALLENEPTEYLTAYVSFFKFYGESMTTADNDVMEQYLSEFSKTFAAYPALYASQLGEIYRIEGKYDKAEALADEVLAVNAADDYATAIKSLAKRISLNVDDALGIAKAGYERSDDADYCAREYVICSILKEDYEAAFDVAAQLYDNWLTYDNLEYIIIITSFYESDDADTQARLDEYREKAEQTLDEAGVTIRETAQKLIDGKLTVIQVFLEDPYYLN